MRRDVHRGFALVSAIFLIVVLAALGGFIATVSTTQHSGSALDVMGAQAYQAARSGTEWGLAKVFADKSAANCSKSFLVDTMTVTVACASVAVPDTAGGTSVEAGLVGIFQITATACNIATAPTGSATVGSCPGDATNPNYVERRLSVLSELL